MKSDEIGCLNSVELDERQYNLNFNKGYDYAFLNVSVYVL